MNSSNTAAMRTGPAAAGSAAGVLRTRCFETAIERRGPLPPPARPVTTKRIAQLPSRFVAGLTPSFGAGAAAARQIAALVGCSVCAAHTMIDRCAGDADAALLRAQESTRRSRPPYSNP